MADKKPRRWSNVWYEERMRDPDYDKGIVLELARAAEGGNQQAFENLFEWLDSHPEMRSAVRHLDDLATRVEREWVVRMGGTIALVRKALADDVAGIRAGLRGPEPSAIEKVLLGTVISAHLAFQRASLAASRGPTTPEVRAAREKLLTAAQRRLQEAARGWNLYSGWKAAGQRPTGTSNCSGRAGGGGRIRRSARHASASRFRRRGRATG